MSSILFFLFCSYLEQLPDLWLFATPERLSLLARTIRSHGLQREVFDRLVALLGQSLLFLERLLGWTAHLGVDAGLLAVDAGIVQLARAQAAALKGRFEPESVFPDPAATEEVRGRGGGATVV